MMEIRIKLDLGDNFNSVILNSILEEAIDQKAILIDRENNEIIIKARSASRGRAIMNSYISWIYTIMETIKKVSNK